MAGLAKLTIPTSVAVIDYEYTFGNFVSTNAFTTTNIFTTNVFVIGNLIDTGNATPGYTTLAITGNVSVSNALTVGSLYANTLSLSNVGSTITLTGNVATPSNAFTTNKVFASGNMVVNGVTNPGVTRVALGDNILVANAIATNNVFTGNVLATGNFTVGGAQIPRTSLNVVGNTVVSNAVTTTNVFTGNVLVTGNLTIDGLVGKTSLNMVGGANGANLYVSNAVTSSNVYLGGVMEIFGIPTGTETVLYGRANLYVSNAVTTTNVWTTNVIASGNMTVAGLPDLTTAIITGNVLVSNTVTTNNVWTKNVYATGNMTIAGLPGFTSVSILGNTLVGNTLTTTNVWTNNVIATGNMTIAGWPGETTARITGNAVVANALVTNNVFTGNLFAIGDVIVTGVRTTGILSVSVNGNAFASNAFITTNVFGTTITANLVYLTGNVFVSNAVQSQNIWATNVYAANVYIKTTGLYADLATKSLGAAVWTSTQAATLTRAAHVPLYVESAGVAPSAGTIWTGDMYFDNSSFYKYINAASPTWSPIAPITLAVPSLTAVGTQSITTTGTTAIQVSQTVDATSVGPVYWSLSGPPSDVFLSNTSSKGATIVVPAFIRGSSTSTVTVSATNASGTVSQQVFSLGITVPAILIGTSRDYPVSNASVLRQFTSTDGNYWYQPPNTDTPPVQLYTNFTNATAGMGLVLIARGRESTDWWNSVGQNFSQTGTTLTSAALNINTPIAVLSDRFVNSLIGNWRNMKLLVNRMNGGDSWYITGTSDGPFSWNLFRSSDGTNNVNFYAPSLRARATMQGYTGTFRTGTLTGTISDTASFIDYDFGGNVCLRLFTWGWSGHGSWQGWSGGAGCTPAGSFQNSTELHAIQLVNCYMEC